MIKTNVIMKNNRRFRVSVRIRFILFYSELAPTDPCCNMLQTLLGPDNMRSKCQMKNL